MIERHPNEPLHIFSDTHVSLLKAPDSILSDILYNVLCVFLYGGDSNVCYARVALQSVQRGMLEHMLWLFLCTHLGVVFGILFYTPNTFVYFLSSNHCSMIYGTKCNVIGNHLRYYSANKTRHKA
jgi:hypothetical protein